MGTILKNYKRKQKQKHKKMLSHYIKSYPEKLSMSRENN